MASWQTYFAFHKHVHVTVHIHQLIPALSSNVILRGGNASKREVRRKAKHPGHTRPTNRDQGPNRTQRHPHGPDQAAHDTPSLPAPARPRPPTQPRPQPRTRPQDTGRARKTTPKHPQHNKSRDITRGWLPEPVGFIMVLQSRSMVIHAIWDTTDEQQMKQRY